MNKFEETLRKKYQLFDEIRALKSALNSKNQSKAPKFDEIQRVFYELHSSN
jgi:hypothetical protein